MALVRMNEIPGFRRGDLVRHQGGQVGVIVDLWETAVDPWEMQEAQFWLSVAWLPDHHVARVPLWKVRIADVVSVLATIADSKDSPSVGEGSEEP